MFLILLRVGIEPRHVSITTLQAAALTTQPSQLIIIFDWIRTSIN